MHPIIKNGLHWAGSALAIAGIAFVVMRLHNYGGQIDLGRFDSVTFWMVTGFSLIYGLANLMLALAWWKILGHFGTNTPKVWSIKIYGISQLAKYIPGNIFHFAGRQAMGMSAGVPGWALAKSTMWELGVISFAGASFALLALPLFTSGLPVVASATLFVIVVTIAAALLRRYFSQLIAYSLACYVGFLAIAGVLFVGLVDLVSVHETFNNLSWIPLCGAYVVAWLAGLATPGAPAGVGIRELVLLFFLKGVVPEADLLLAVVLGRMVTVAGDTFFFVGAIFVNHRRSSNDN